FLKQHQVKAMVVACNTASAVALDALKQHYAIPVLGVIEPGARAAAQSTLSGKVALIGTEATVKSRAYEKALKSIKADLEIQSQACPLFVPLVEEGWNDHPITEEVARIYLKGLKSQGVDTVILGCTHYPLLKTLLSRVLGTSIKLVDSAQESAMALQTLLKDKELLSLRKTLGSQSFYCSDAPEKMQSLGSAFLGKDLGKVEQVILD
ncbi:MAG: glutamate racemase, partial [Deltaproteobacteria bacterium]|nr:glutamate racemase [Deltaproteobacteria bacterium]